MDFWKIIEDELSIQIPNHLKNALNLCGFGNPISFKLLTNSALDSVEKFVRQKLPDNIVKNKKCELENYFGELYARDPTSFEFQLGERILIEQLVNFVEKKDLAHFKNAPNHAEVADIPIESQQTNYFLEMLKKTANKNAAHKPGGYRYDIDTKRFAAYLRLICGKFAYDTLSNNNLPSAVHISEDATRIVGRVEYDAKTNQIIGFVLPIKANNGLPIPFSYPAKSSEDIIAHFSGRNRISSFVNVLMAQPLGNVPAFCLLVSDLITDIRLQMLSIVGHRLKEN